MSADEIRVALEEAESELQAAYRKVWPLREALAEAVPPAALPSRRKRTDKQALIARCPRCGTQIRDDMECIRQIILRGWDDHMWNFEMMDEEDEKWLLTWAGHPSAPDVLQDPEERAYLSTEAKREAAGE